MVRWTERRRTFLAEKFGDLANLAVAALVFGQALGEGGFSLSLGLLGIAVWLALTAIGFAFSGAR